MHLSDYNKYIKKYRKGIKYISYQTNRIVIQKEPIDLILDQFSENFMLYFNKIGILMASFHKKKHKPAYRTNYSYNRKGLLISAVDTQIYNCELKTISEFEYNSEGRIAIETERDFHFSSHSRSILHHIHTYTDNKEELFITMDCEYEDEYQIYKTYNNTFQNVTEEKAFRNEEELIYWYLYEYDDNGKIVKSSELNDNGEIKNTTEHYNFRSGQKSVYIEKTVDGKSITEYNYTTNNKGHWINKVQIDDGDPRFVFDRLIEYY